MAELIGTITEGPEYVEWTIADFLSLQGRYRSPVFSFAAKDWTLRIEVFEINGRYIYLYLRNLSSDRPIQHEYSISVKSPEGRKYRERKWTKDFRYDDWFSLGCITLDLQRKSEWLQEGKLTLLCSLKQKQRNAEEGEEIATANNLEAGRPEVAAADEPKSSDCTVTKSRESSELIINCHGSLINVPEEYDFTPDFDHFLEERRGIDVTFVFETPNGKEEIFAHKLVLALRSSYFADELYGEQGNRQMQVVSLKNVNPKPFKHMLRYCYGQKPCLRIIEETCALLEVASQFKIISLMRDCQTFLRCAEIEPGNVLSVLIVSEKIEDKSLRDRCNKLLQEKTKEVLESYELRDVTQSMVRVILYLPKLSLCSEYELIKWIFDWAKVKSEEADSIHKNCREYLEKLLPDMNFLDLTLEEFAILCKDNQGFFSPVEYQSISMNIASPGTMEMPAWYNKDLRFRDYAGLNE